MYLHLNLEDVCEGQVRDEAILGGGEVEVIVAARHDGSNSLAVKQNSTLKDGRINTQEKENQERMRQKMRCVLLYCIAHKRYDQSPW